MNEKYFSIKNNMLDIYVQVPQWYRHFYYNNSIKLNTNVPSIKNSNTVWYEFHCDVV